MEIFFKTIYNASVCLFKKEIFMDNNFNENYGTASSAYAAPSLEVKTENVLMGTVGAILGALAGALCIVLLQKIGYIASISGVVMAFLSLMLYDKFAGKLSVKGIIICCVIMIATVFLTEWTTLAFEYSKILKEYSSEYTVGYCFKKLWYFMELDEYKGTFFRNLLMLYAFTALGAIPKIKQFATEGSAKVVKADAAALHKPVSEVVTEEATTADENAVKTFDKDFFN